MQGAFDGGFLKIARGQAGLGMHAGHTHQVQVGPQLGSGLDHAGPHIHHGMAEQPAAQHQHLDLQVPSQRHRHGRAVRDHGGAQVQRQVLHHLQRCGASVQDHHLAGQHQRGPGAAQGALVFGGQLFARLQIAHSGRGGQGAAVHTLQAALGGQLAQVAPHGVFRDAQLFAEGLGHDLAVLPQAVEQELFALGGQHERLDKEIARICMFVHDIA